MEKLKIGFICVHNSCRSQMAEAICKVVASDMFIPYSAGTEIKPQINQDAVKVINDLYNVDMNKTQHSKLLEDIPELDIVITMGCNVSCPNLPCKYREDFGLSDPSSKELSEYISTAKIIEEKILALKDKILTGEISL